jgi:predicted Zn-dependent peptidase
LDLFKQQVRGSILLGSDDMENRMTSLGINEMTFGEYVPVEKVVGEIENVTAKDVLEAARTILDEDKMSIIAMGEFDAGKVQKLINEV